MKQLIHLHFFVHFIKLNLIFFYLIIINFSTLPKSLCHENGERNTICNMITHECQDAAAATTRILTRSTTTNANAKSVTASANPPALPPSFPPALAPTSPPAFGKTVHLPVGVIIAVMIINIIAIMAVILYCLRRKFSLKKCMVWKKTKNLQSIETFLKMNESLAHKRYKYSDIKKMTNSFKDKLGKGAYGHVYRGKLFDGRTVAVKLLKESKGDGQDFINEVASISRTSHVNIVTFLGFCVEYSKRALIYEFMPNGSLEKFIYDQKSIQKNPHILEWKTLYKIAFGIARGLEYLHLGCNTRIVHFDIKPHNILLDQDFSPKISDFGLAKLCFKKESIISKIAIRGTPGYIAPELISRDFGGVSHKSDVYSYGMMVLEMVGGRKNINEGVEDISELYFPHWIHKRLDTGMDLGLRGISIAEDEEIARKMTIVGLWCIQMDPSSRPAMNKVVEMLEGNLEALKIPPMQFFHLLQDHELPQPNQLGEIITV